MLFPWPNKKKVLEKNKKINTDLVSFKFFSFNCIFQDAIIKVFNKVNLFFIKKGRVLTSTGEFCLNGITRSKAIKICKMNKIPCNETNFTFEDIKDCEEAFVTGTFAGIIPVSKIENYMLSSTNTNSLVNKIRASYNQYINQSIESQW